MKSINKISGANFFASILFIPIFILSHYIAAFNLILFMLSCLLLIGQLKRSYETPVFLFTIFISLFYLPFFMFYFFHWKISLYNTFNTPENVIDTSRIFFLFQYILFVSLDIPRNYIPVSDRIEFRQNNVIFYGALALAVVLLFSSLSGQTIFFATYGHQKKIGTSFYEYIIPLILIAYIFSGKSKERITYLISFTAIYIIRDLLFGGRISSVQIVLLFYLLLVDKRIRFKYILIGIIAGIIFLKSFEVIRVNSQLIHDPLGTSISKLLFSSHSNKVYGSNEGGVVHSSIRLIGMLNDGIISLRDRMVSFLLFLVSAFNPRGNLPPLANLTAYMQSVYPCGGGGLFPVYFFVWGGYLGVILGGVFVSWLINSFFKTKNMLLIIYTTMILCTFPRWLAYNPIITVKLSLAPVYLYLIIIQFYIYGRKKKNPDIL
jgi:hypothetical protein